MKTIKIKSKFTVSSEQLAAVAFVLYFSMPLLKRIVQLFVAGFSLYVSIAITYIPVVLLLFFGRFQIKRKDVLFLFLSVLFFFGITWLTHPNYSFFYLRDYYGIWDYVLRPDNGIYAYFFIRNIGDPKKILKYLRISSWLMFVHLGLEFFDFVRLGYWLAEKDGKIVHNSYNLMFGYDVLLYELVFLYSALRNKKPIHIVMSVVGCLMILAGGSRGPIICILLFLLVYVLFYLEKSRKKQIILVTLVAVFIILYFGFVPILNGISEIMAQFGLSSRFLKMLTAGTVLDDNGRNEIWQAAVQMIGDKPWGYGAMGSRHGIYSIIQVGHPHNIFLEILIDYGVIVGSGLIVGMIIYLIRVFRLKGLDDFKGVVIIFLGFSFMLLLSGTYWHRICIWGLLGACVNIHYYQKGRKNE